MRSRSTEPRASRALYTYPEHLRAAAQAAPAAPGVYIFQAEGDTLPLYIGKSINLRARLLAHLRNPDEARMLRQATHIAHIRTAGEIGALLLEAQLIKQQQPLFNQKLRRNRQLCALHLPPGRACFGAMLGRCRGVCCGKESPAAHAQRLHAALESLRIATWPYPGAIGLHEQGEALQHIHVVRNWCYLGSADTLPQARALAQVAAGFDADGYKILCRPILTGQLPVVEL